MTKLYHLKPKVHHLYLYSKLQTSDLFILNIKVYISKIVFITIILSSKTTKSNITKKNKT